MDEIQGTRAERQVAVEMARDVLAVELVEAGGNARVGPLQNVLVSQVLARRPLRQAARQRQRRRREPRRRVGVGQDVLLAQILGGRPETQVPLNRCESIEQ